MNVFGDTGKERKDIVPNVMATKEVIKKSKVVVEGRPGFEEVSILESKVVTTGYVFSKNNNWLNQIQESEEGTNS